MYAKIIPTSYICKYTCVYLYYILYKAAFFMYKIYIYIYMYNMSLCGLKMYIYTYIHIYIYTYIHKYIYCKHPLCSPGIGLLCPRWLPCEMSMGIAPPVRCSCPLDS